MAIRLQLCLPAGADSATVARGCLQGLARVIDSERFEDAQLLISELVTNSYRHGSDEPSWIEVHIVYEPECVRIEVTDPGPGFKAQNLPEPSPSNDAGWGLFLVDRIATRWGVQRSDSTTQVWVELGQRRLINA